MRLFSFSFKEDLRFVTVGGMAKLSGSVSLGRIYWLCSAQTLKSEI